MFAFVKVSFSEHYSLLIFMPLPAARQCCQRLVFSGCLSALFIHPFICSSRQTLLTMISHEWLEQSQWELQEYSLVATDDLVRFWRLKVKVIASCRGHAHRRWGVEFHLLVCICIWCLPFLLKVLNVNFWSWIVNLGAWSWSWLETWCQGLDSGSFAPLCEKVTLLIKLELHNILHCRQRRTKPRLWITCTEDLVDMWFVPVLR